MVMGSNNVGHCTNVILQCVVASFSNAPTSPQAEGTNNNTGTVSQVEEEHNTGRMQAVRGTYGDQGGTGREHTVDQTTEEYRILSATPKQ